MSSEVVFGKFSYPISIEKEIKQRIFLLAWVTVWR
ncbi:hypothetical protein LINPERHAP1_LOCUS20149 [Linum perenne]